MIKDFAGAKIALLYKDKILIYLRDKKRNIPHSGMWDLPGGKREYNETPFRCAQRETYEEFSIKITKNNISWLKKYPSKLYPGKNSYFLVSKISKKQIDSIKFGLEGQNWKLVKVKSFLKMKNAVSYLKERVQEYKNL